MSARAKRQKLDSSSIPISEVVPMVSVMPMAPPRHFDDVDRSNPTLTDPQERALLEQGFTRGLAAAMARNRQIFPLRIWVVDNSGSMAANDGKRLVETARNSDVRFATCSRWTEIRECVSYHGQMAALLGAPTTFRLLNDPGRFAGPQQFSVAETTPEMVDDELRVARETMSSAQPRGVTPLSRHVREIRENVFAMRNDLLETGRRVAVVIATDGLPTDEYGYSGDGPRREFERSLRSLEGLPVWIVVRLCTDEDDAVEYYNNLDANLELSLEVLDDFVGEAAEVASCNAWLNYALPLHRIRETGFHHRLFDLLDERQLSIDELREFLFLLFGSDEMDGLPDPIIDFDSFADRVGSIVQNNGKQWNPMTRKMEYWIDIYKLRNAYGRPQSSCILM